MTERQTNGIHPDSKRRPASAGQQVASMVNSRRRGVTVSTAEAEIRRIVESQRTDPFDVQIQSIKKQHGRISLII